MTELTENQERSKKEIIMERKKRLVQNPRSIVIRVSNASIPANIVRAIFDLDKVVNNIMKNTGFTVSLQDAKKAIEEVKKLSSSLWEEIKKVVPSLYAYNHENWQELNDRDEAKETLARARNAMVFIPRSNECAQIAIGFKVLGRVRLEYSNTGNLEGVNKIAKIITDYAEKINSLNLTLSKNVQKSGENNGNNDN